MNNKVKINLTIALICLIGQQSHALFFCNPIIGCPSRYPYEVPSTMWGTFSKGGLLGCAPEIEQSNIDSVQAVLTQLSENELKASSELRELVETLPSLSQKEKMSTYLAVLGIQSDEELIQFIFSRNVDPKYVTTLSKNLNLSDEGSLLMIKRVSQSLIGQRK